MKRLARAAAGVALLLGIYVLAVGIVATLVAVAVYAIREQYPEAVAGQLVGLAFITTVGLVAGVLHRRRTDEEMPGIRVEHDDQPRLWAEVRDLAATVRTRPPDEIRLVPDVNAAVSEQIRMLGLVGGHRVLYLGAPVLLALTRQQLRSVVAHELGHYSRRHTALGAVTFRGRDALGGVVERFGARSLVGRIFRTYEELYVVLTAAAARQRELEADDFAVEVGGRDAAAAALAELPLLHAAWDHYFEQFVSPVHATGKRPSNFFEGLAEILEAPRLQEALATFRTDFDDGPLARDDSHPPLSTRIARIRALPDDGVPEEPERAVDLLDHTDVTLHELQEWMYRTSQLQPAPWEQLLHGHEPAEVRARAEVIYRVARKAGLAEVTLGTLVGAVRGRLLSSWVRPHLEDPSGENIRTASRELMKSAVDEALMTVAGVRMSLAWDDEPRFVDPSGRELDSLPVVVEAMHSGDPSVLADWLDEHGVGLDCVPVFPAVDPREELRAQPPKVLESLAPVAGRHTLFLVVLNHGVLLRRGRPMDHVAWWTGGTNPGKVLLRRVRDRTAAELLAESGNVWLPWDRIVSVTVGRGRTGQPKLTFAGTDGSTHVAKFRLQTRDTGSSVTALKFFLQDRLAAEPATRFRRALAAP
jgi:Zn-dependent protease with chaperone function